MTRKQVTTLSIVGLSNIERGKVGCNYRFYDCMFYLFFRENDITVNYFELVGIFLDII